MRRASRGGPWCASNRGIECEGCGASGLCHAAADDRREIEADDLLGCAAGDRVRIEVPGGQVLRMSFLIYGLPLLLLLAGVGLGAVLIPAGPWRDPGSFLLAVGLAAAAFPVVRSDRQASRRGWARPCARGSSSGSSPG